MIDWYEEAKIFEKELLNDLVELLKINSVGYMGSLSLENPVGEGPRRALDKMYEFAKRDGFIHKDINHLSGHIQLGEARDIFGILGHVDVVEASGEWSHDPFIPRFENGKIIARGVLDNKGPLVAAYYAMKILKKKKISLSKKIRLIIGTDEETNWKCIEDYLKHEETPVMGFSPDAFFPVVHAEKGLISLKLESVNHCNDGILRSFVSDMKENMVPQSASALLFSTQGKSIIKLAQRYADLNGLKMVASYDKSELNLHFIGKAAHSMNPEKGINAACHLATFLSFHCKHTFLDFVKTTLVSQHNGTGLGIFTNDNIMGQLSISPSCFEYTEIQKFSCVLNIRYPRSISLDVITSMVETYALKYLLKCSILNHKNIHFVDPDSTLVKTLLDVYEFQMHTKASTLSIGGATYARAIPNTVAFGALFPNRTNTMHQVDESMHTEDIIKACAIYAHALYKLVSKTS